ncbi:hypothetical protein WMF30_22230 [Sorangium sp. So ce134]
MAAVVESEAIFFRSNATPLSDLTISGLRRLPFLPTQSLELPEDLEAFLADIGIANLDVATTTDDAGESTSRASFDLIVARELSLGIPGLDGFSLVVGSNDAADGTKVGIALEWGKDYALSVTAKLALRFSRALLKPVKANTSGAGPKWIEDKDGHAEIGIDTTMRIDGEGNISFDAGGFSLDAAMIGDSGVVVSFKEITLVLSQAALDELPSKPSADFRGVYIGKATLDLPETFNELGVGDLELTRTYIGSGGFSGKVSVDWTDGGRLPGLGGTLGGLRASLKKLDLELVQNAFKSSSLEASITLPFFEAPLDVDIGFALDGSFTVGLGAKSGLVRLKKEDVLELTLESIKLGVRDGAFFVTLSGQVKPLFAGISWPGFKVDALTVDSRGNVHIDGGWINLREKYAIDFYGFKLEISKLGFGNDDDGSKWIGFSGGIRLVDALPAGASVEGLRFAWRDGKPGVDVSFKGIGVEFAVPDVLSFKGAVDYSTYKQKSDADPTKEIDVRRFDGDIVLDIQAIGLRIDAKLVIGFAGEYSFFGIYLGVDLPAGIPLWATGLAIYGMAGLFAYNMEPNKLPDQEWYGALGDGGAAKTPGWYVNDPIGVTSLDRKWTGKNGSLAFGAGITLGTVFDNGFTFSSKLLFAMVFPGPILLFEGKTNLFKERSKLDQDPVFRTLLVLDFREGSFLFGLSVNYQYADGGELVKLNGSSEIYFNAAKADAWHVWIGKKEPRDKRIRAEIFRLFGADFYLMVDQQAFAMGSWIGYEADWKFGPVRILLEAWLEWNVRVNWSPAQLHGDVWLHGKIGVYIGPFGLSLSGDARLSADVFRPYHILGDVQVEVDLPWPLPDFGFSVSVEWGPEPVPPPIPSPLKEIALEHPKSTISWPLAMGSRVRPVYEATAATEDAPPPGFLDVDTQAAADKRYADIHPDEAPPADAPVVPVDVRPRITFNKAVHDDKKIGMSVHDPSPAYELIGDPAQKQGPAEVRYSLAGVEFDTWNGAAWVRATSMRYDPGKRAYVPAEMPVYGSWAAVPASPAGAQASIGQLKLSLWQKNPLYFGRAANSMYGSWLRDDFCRPYPCPPPPVRESRLTCNFEREAPARGLRSPWGFPAAPRLRLHWATPHAPEIERRVAVPGFSQVFSVSHAEVLDLVVALPEPANAVELTFDAVTAASPGLSVRGIDAAGLGRFPSTRAGERVVIDAGEEALVAVAIRRAPDPDQRRDSRGPWVPTSTCLAEITTIQRHPDAEREALERHVRQQILRWQDEGDVFLPNTDYRMTVVVGVHARGLGSLAHWERSFVLKQVAHFRTAGPPGIGALSRPDNIPTAKQVADEDPKALQRPSPETFDETMGGLADLTPYVRQTVPATVPAAGDQPALPPPYYRGYDLGVRYDESYVELMYRMAGRDLNIALFDSGARPARDVEGRLLAPKNRWGRAEDVILSETDKLWIRLKNDACAPLDPLTIKRDSTLDASGQVLSPQTLYEARLIPALLHDDFRALLGSPPIAGPSAALGRWTVRDEPRLGGEVSLSSFWRVEEVVLEGESTVFMAQKSGYGSTGAEELAAILWYDAERPGDFEDYRLSAFLRTEAGQTGEIGLAFRHRHGGGGGKPSYYVFAMGNARDRSFRRLARVKNGVATELAPPKAQGYASDRDYFVVIEAVRDELRVYVDDELVFSVQEQAGDRLDAGTVGLYSRFNSGALFSDVRVDDLRAEAPSVVRYSFVTSRYVDFHHHVHSFQDVSWTTALAQDASAHLAKAVPSATAPASASLEETQAYDALARIVLPPGVPAQPSEVQVTKLTREVNEREVVVALHLQSPESLDFSRVTFDLRFADLIVPAAEAPSAVKITDVRFANLAAGEALNDESITLLLREAVDLTGCAVEVRPLFGSAGDDPGAPPWTRYCTFGYTFGAEGRMAAGTKVVLHAGKKVDGQPDRRGAGVARRFLEGAGPSAIRLPRMGLVARLVGPHAHERSFVDATLTRPVACSVLRKADSAGIFLVLPDGKAWEPGFYELTLAFARDNRSRDPESAVLKRGGEDTPERATLAILVE